MKITYLPEPVERERSSFPTPGIYMGRFIGDDWYRLIVVTDRDFQEINDCLLTSVEGEFNQVFLPFCQEEEPPVPVVEKVTGTNLQGEPCVLSYNDLLRALAAAAGTLPKEIL